MNDFTKPYDDSLVLQGLLSSCHLKEHKIKSSYSVHPKSSSIFVRKKPPHDLKLNHFVLEHNIKIILYILGICKWNLVNFGTWLTQIHCVFFVFKKWILFQRTFLFIFILGSEESPSSGLEGFLNNTPKKTIFLKINLNICKFDKNK